MSRGRLPIVVVLIGSLLASTYLRRKVVAQREAFDVGRGVAINKQGRVSQVPSYALGLLLGGLRGPLAIMLWTSSENQKIDRNMEDFHTKVELIRLLQGDFPTVFLYESWNMAYNWSVHAANASSKYAILLDSIQFDNRAEAESPDNINVVMQTGQLYFDKFGNASEKLYYSPRLREETRAGEDHVRMRFSPQVKDEFAKAVRMAGSDYYNIVPIERTEDGNKVFYLSVRKSLFDRLPATLTAQAKWEVIPFRPVDAGNTAAKAVRHDQLLNADGTLLESVVKPLAGRDPTYTAADGSTLPYLKQLEPFPYGVSPFALSYNYSKRARWIMINRGSHHVQLSDRVVSSRPALSLMKWAEEEKARARRCELDSLGLAIPVREEDLDIPSQSIKLDHALVHGPLVDEAIHSYQRAANLSALGIKEFEEHIELVIDDTTQYRSHMHSLRAQIPYYTADAAYLRAMISKDEERAKQIAIVRQNYDQAADIWARLLITYYGGDPTVAQCFPAGKSPTTLNSWTHDDVVSTAIKAGQLMHTVEPSMRNDDVMEYANYVTRCVERVKNLP